MTGMAGGPGGGQADDWLEVVVRPRAGVEWLGWLAAAGAVMLVGAVGLHWWQDLVARMGDSRSASPALIVDLSELPLTEMVADPPPAPPDIPAPPDPAPPLALPMVAPLTTPPTMPDPAPDAPSPDPAPPDRLAEAAADAPAPPPPDTLAPPPEPEVTAEPEPPPEPIPEPEAEPEWVEVTAQPPTTRPLPRPERLPAPPKPAQPAPPARKPAPAKPPTAAAPPQPSRSSGSGAQGGGAAGARGTVSPNAMAQWQAGVQRQIASHMQRLRVPAAGRAVLLFTLSGNGSVTGVTLQSGTGNATADSQILAHARRLGRLPAPPNARPTTLRLPVTVRR